MTVATQTNQQKRQICVHDYFVVFFFLVNEYDKRIKTKKIIKSQVIKHPL